MPGPDRDGSRDRVEAIASGTDTGQRAGDLRPAGDGLDLVADVARAFHDLRSGDGPAAEGATPGPPRPETTPGAASASDGVRHWGSLEVRRPLGRGGFGTVYEAWDPALQRVVALKLHHDPGSSRFLEEARRLARVRHPNVLTIHGAAVHDERSGLWADLVDGRTLAEWIGENGPMGPGEATSVGIDLARALAAIHRAGLVHGDVKPSNVMREVGGRIVLMDFGAAREDRSVTEEPVEGTPATVAPEVLVGAQPTPVSDLYSVGVLLFFLLTGDLPLQEVTYRSVRAAHDSGRRHPLSDLRSDLPASLVAVVERALEPDPQRRFQSAGELERALSGAAIPGLAAPGAGGSPWPGRVGWLAATALGLALLAVAWTREPGAESRQALLAALPLPAPASPRPLADGSNPRFAITADGSRVAYIAGEEDERVIRFRDLASSRWMTLPATRGAYDLMFSPDGDWIAFAADNRLRKISTSGGSVVDLAPFTLFLGGHWAGNDRIYYAPRPGAGILSVAADGGPPREETRPDLGAMEGGHFNPVLLPDGRTLLHTVELRGDESSRVVARRGDEEHVLLDDVLWASYVPGGHLVWFRKERLYAAPFDPDRLEQTGPGRVVIDDLLVSSNAAIRPALAFSGNGTVVFARGGYVGNDTEAVWVSRDGSATPLQLPPAFWLHPRIAPGGDRLAIAQRLANDHVWLVDLQRATTTRLTFEHENLAPIWQPDGRFLTIAYHDTGPINLHRLRTDGSGRHEPFTEGPMLQIPVSWSADGRLLAFQEDTEDNGSDIRLYRAGGDPRGEPLLATRFDETQPVFSPDGGWLAYVSDESGRPEIYVRSIAEPARKLPASRGEARDPRWHPDGSALYYWSGDTFHEVRVLQRGDGIELAPPTALFEGRYERVGFGANYDVAGDGRFLMMRAAAPLEPLTSLDLLVDPDWLDDP